MDALRRSRSHVARSAGMVLLTLAALGSAVVACKSSEKAPSDTLGTSRSARDSLIPGRQIVALRECPHDWKDYVRRLPNAAPDSTFRAVGARTAVVEYHDCQKFITENGQAYDQLVAIFASVTVSHSAAQLAAATAASPVALASALILDFDDPYKNLHIESGFKIGRASCRERV